MSVHEGKRNDAMDVAFTNTMSYVIKELKEKFVKSKDLNIIIENETEFF